MSEARRSRQRSTPETYARILDVAREAFSERGFMGANLEAIARESGVTKQVVYYHFGSRSGLYQAVVWAVAEQSLRRLLELEVEGRAPLDAIGDLFGRMFDFHVDSPSLTPLVLDFTCHGAGDYRVREVQRRVLRRYDDLVERGKSDGSVAADVDGREVFLFAVMMINGCFLQRDRLWGFEATGSLASRRAQVLRAIRAIYGHRSH